MLTTRSTTLIFSSAASFRRARNSSILGALVHPQLPILWSLGRCQGVHSALRIGGAERLERSPGDP
jgi:hypothetical protein